jgi:cellulose synthase/poly-beta-1,6-N-acetylglucosamine synthase-like glycosyltransferase
VNLVDPASESPQVSVIVPARNEEATLPITLPHALRALANIRRPAELLVVIPEDCSFRVAPPVTHPALRWVVTPVPGKYQALCHGVAASRGPVLIFLDADVFPHVDALDQLVETVFLEGVSAVAGRIVMSSHRGNPIQSALAMWTEISFASWHRLRANQPELRWALPGAMYALRRELFPLDGLLVPSLDDASIGMHLVDDDLVIEYAPSARVEVCAPRSMGQWCRQKLRTRRGWRLLKELRAEEVGALQDTLSLHTANLCAGRHLAQLLRLGDRTMALAADRLPIRSDHDLSTWNPDRAGWQVGQRARGRSTSGPRSTSHT